MQHSHGGCLILLNIEFSNRGMCSPVLSEECHPNVLPECFACFLCCGPYLLVCGNQACKYPGRPHYASMPLCPRLAWLHGALACFAVDRQAKISGETSHSCDTELGLFMQEQSCAARSMKHLRLSIQCCKSFARERRISQLRQPNCPTQCDECL